MAALKFWHDIHKVHENTKAITKDLFSFFVSHGYDDIFAFVIIFLVFSCHCLLLFIPIYDLKLPIDIVIIFLKIDIATVAKLLD